MKLVLLMCVFISPVFSFEINDTLLCSDKDSPIKLEVKVLDKTKSEYKLDILVGLFSVIKWVDKSRTETDCKLKE